MTRNLPAREKGSRFGRNRRAIGWGFVDQACSSVTNLGLSILAGRLLGPDGLGRVLLGFSVYLVALNLQRRLLIEPLLSATSALDQDRRSRTAARGLTMCVSLGFLCTAGVLILAATVLRGFADRGLLLIAPWLIPTLVQDYWRNVLFRDKRASAAAANDGVWLVMMVLALPALLWWQPSDWAVMGWWGVGASAGAIYGFFQTRIFPAPPGGAWRWFRKHAWPFGKWNAAAGTLAGVGTQLGRFVLAGMLGAAALGGWGAAWTVFGPLSLLAPAIALPGLPAMARAHARGEGRRLAIELSVFTVGASVAYFLMLLLGGWRLLPFLFGESFAQYRGLIWPVATAQVVVAAEIGFLLLIKAQQRGGVLMLIQTPLTVVGLALQVVLTLEYGLMGATWTAAVMSLLSLSMLSFAALRGPRSAGSTADTGGPALVTEAAETGDPLIYGGDGL